MEPMGRSTVSWVWGLRSRVVFCLLVWGGGVKV